MSERKDTLVGDMLPLFETVKSEEEGRRVRT